MCETGKCSATLLHIFPHHAIVLGYKEGRKTAIVETLYGAMLLIFLLIL